MKEAAERLFVLPENASLDESQRHRQTLKFRLFEHVYVNHDNVRVYCRW